MAFKVTLIEHGVILAEGRSNRVSGAIRWANSVLTEGCERAYIGAFGQVIAKYENGAWMRLPFHN